MQELELHPAKLLVLPDEEETVSSGGIHLPETAYSKEKPMFGVVVAYGSGPITGEGKQIPVNSLFPSLEEGSRVMFGGFVGQPVMIDKVRHLMLRYEDVYAVCRPVEAASNGASGRRRKKE